MLPRTSATLDIQALRHNLRVIRERSPYQRILAMVKANAYGHGMTLISKALEQLGEESPDIKVDFLGVANVDEAIELRVAGIRSRIVVMSGVMDSEELYEAIWHHCDVVLHTQHQIQLLQSLPHQGSHCRVWLKVNTGMNRLGLSPSDAVDAYQTLLNHPAVTFESVVTHFACADDPDHPLNEAQLAQLAFLMREMHLPVSCCNSAGMLLSNLPPHSIVRPGLALYGYWPQGSGSQRLNAPLKPVMTLRARIISKYRISPGESVGYGGVWRATRDTDVAIVAMGYGDGFPQNAPEGVGVWAVNRRVPLIGKVSMDSFAIDVTSVSIGVGDYVEIWGASHPLDELSTQLHVSMYALLAGLSRRIVRELSS